LAAEGLPMSTPPSMAAMGPDWYQSGTAEHLPTFADNHDTLAVTGGLHPLLDISPKSPRGGVLTLTDPRGRQFFCKLALTCSPDPNP